MRIASCAVFTALNILPIVLAQTPQPRPPYSAKQTTTQTQMLADGTTITHMSTGLTARDAYGRIRTETINTMPEGAETHSVWINDPVEQVNMSWTTGNPSTPQVVNISHFRQVSQMPARNPQPGRYYPSRSESMPPNTINGLYATGTRFTRTIPAGAENNDRDIEVTTETWFSPELGVAIRSVTSDPRRGKTYVELTDIVLGDPDPALFKAPAGYQLRDQTLQSSAAGMPEPKESGSEKPVPSAAAAPSTQTPAPGQLPLQTTSGTGFTGAPYSGKETTVTTQTAADGSKYSRTDVTMLWRDAEGRTRQEHIEQSPSGAEQRGVIITDPIAGVYLKWTIGGDAPSKTVTIWPLAERQRITAPPPPHAAATAPPAAAATAPAAVPASAPASAPEIPPTARAFTHETLPPQEINGVYAEGSRSKRIVRSGTAGNDRDIQVINELWISPDLRIIVRHIMDDPRTGLVATDVTDVVRGELDSALFKAPPGFETRDMRK